MCYRPNSPENSLEFLSTFLREGSKAWFALRSLGALVPASEPIRLPIPPQKLTLMPLGNCLYRLFGMLMGVAFAWSNRTDFVAFELLSAGGAHMIKLVILPLPVQNACGFVSPWMNSVSRDEVRNTVMDPKRRHRIKSSSSHRRRWMSSLPSVLNTGDVIDPALVLPPLRF